MAGHGAQNAAKEAMFQQQPYSLVLAQRRSAGEMQDLHIMEE